MTSLTHLDSKGKARMVDVGQKGDTERVAVARGKVIMKPATLQLIKAGELEKVQDLYFPTSEEIFEIHRNRWSRGKGRFS